MNKPNEKIKHDTLILEDDAKDASDLEGVALKHGIFNILAITEKASEAWEVVKANQPDFLIIDLHLTEGDGDLLIEKIRSTYRYTDYYPFISVVSARLAEPVTKRILAPLVNDMWTKNANYNPHNIFASFLSKKARELEYYHQYSGILNPTPTKKLIMEYLCKYTITKENKKRLVTVVAVFVSAIERPIKITSFEKACKYVADTHEISSNMIKSTFTTFVINIFDSTDDDILEKVFTDYTHSPSASQFFNEMLDVITEHLDMYH